MGDLAPTMQTDVRRVHAALGVEGLLVPCTPRTLGGAWCWPTSVPQQTYMRPSLRPLARNRDR